MAWHRSRRKLTLLAHSAATANLAGLTLVCVAAVAIWIHERMAGRNDLVPFLYALAPAVAALMLMVVTAPFVPELFKKERAVLQPVVRQVVLFFGAAIGFAWLSEYVFWPTVTLDFHLRTERVWLNPGFALPQTLVGALLLSRVMPRRKRL